MFSYSARFARFDLRPRCGAPPGRPNAPAAPPRWPGRPPPPPPGRPRYRPPPPAAGATAAAAGPPPRRRRGSSAATATTGTTAGPRTGATTAGAGRAPPGPGRGRRDDRRAPAGDRRGRGGMLPGDMPPPGRGAPGRGACGRGIGRSTGCCDENGLLPTRGVRAAGLGAAWRPGRAVGREVRPVREPRAARSPLGRGRGPRVPPVPVARRRPGCRGRRGLGGAALRGRRAWPRRPGRRAVAVGLDLVGGRLGAAERFAQPARDGRLHGGGRRLYEFALFTKPGEHFLAGDTEFLCQLVYAGLTCHYISCLEAQRW